MSLHHISELQIFVLPLQTILNPSYTSLQDEDWFHGVLPREEVVRLLVNEGDYLVRETYRNDSKQIVLSVCWEGHKHFIIQTTADVCHFLFLFCICALCIVKF